MNGNEEGTPLVRIAALFEKTDRSGTTYFIGTLATGSRLLVVTNKDRRDDREPTHWLLVGKDRDRQGVER